MRRRVGHAHQHVCIHAPPTHAHWGTRDSLSDPTARGSASAGCPWGPGGDAGKPAPNTFSLVRPRLDHKAEVARRRPGAGMPAGPPRPHGKGNRPADVRSEGGWLRGGRLCGCGRPVAGAECLWVRPPVSFSISSVGNAGGGGLSYGTDPVQLLLLERCVRKQDGQSNIHFSNVKACGPTLTKGMTEPEENRRR